jgi:hypothetical protein
MFFAPLAVFFELQSVLQGLFIFMGKIIDAPADRTLQFDEIFL